MATERKFTKENLRRVLLKEYMMKVTQRAGFGGLEIQRTPMGTRITLTVERPGLVIGRKGSAITELTDIVSKKYGFYNPQIEVREAKNHALNAQIMAQKVAFSLERGWHFRRIGHSTVRRIMEAGAKGCQVIIAGKLTGQRHRTEKYRAGHIKYCGDTAEKFMEIGRAVAKKKLGVIGVTVMIMRPDAKLPDEITVKDRPTPAPSEEKKEEEEEVTQEEGVEENVEENKPEEKAEETTNEEPTEEEKEGDVNGDDKNE